MQITIIHDGRKYRCYQDDVLRAGHVPGILTGADLRGKAREYGGRYKASRQELRAYVKSEYGVEARLTRVGSRRCYLWVDRTGEPTRFMTVEGFAQEFGVNLGGWRIAPMVSSLDAALAARRTAIARLSQQANHLTRAFDLSAALRECLQAGCEDATDVSCGGTENYHDGFGLLPLYEEALSKLREHRAAREAMVDALKRLAVSQVNSQLAA